MDFRHLAVEDRGPVRIVTISRPEVLNALDAEVVAELDRCVAATLEQRTIRGLIVTGAGKAFVAGADIAAMSTMDPAAALALAEAGHALGDRIAGAPIPVVAAVNGFALGGGCELALACDVVYASEAAKFGQPEVKLGVIPGFGGTQRLVRRVGLGRALELCMSGDVIDAARALSIGLVDRVVGGDALLEQSVALLERCAKNGPLAVARVKDVVRRGVELPLSEANRLEQAAFSACFATADQKEGMAAFLGKRPAKFEGA